MWIGLRDDRVNFKELPGRVDENMQVSSSLDCW